MPTLSPVSVPVPSSTIQRPKPKEARQHDATKSDSSHEVGDADMLRILTRGAMFGAPAMYLVVLLGAMSSLGWRNAAIAALVPAIFGGPWAGGAVFLAKHFVQVASHTQAPTVTPAVAQPKSKTGLDRAA